MFLIDWLNLLRAGGKEADFDKLDVFGRLARGPSPDPVTVLAVVLVGYYCLQV